MTEKKEVQNIVLVTLNDNFSKRVTSFLAEKLDMHFVDCYDMVVYDLINPKEVIDKCGIEYFKMREKGVIKNCSSFLNTCISINYDLLVQNLECFNKSYIIYLKLPYEKITKIPNKIDFENRDKRLEKIADNCICLDKKSCNRAAELIIKRMGELYENS